MSRLVEALALGVLTVAIMGSGCVAQSPSADGGAAPAGQAATPSAMAGKEGSMDRTVTLVDSAAFEICPVPVGEARLMLFDAQSWPAHRAAAAASAPSLAGWSPDFGSQSVLLIALGEKPTLGHGIGVRSPLQANGDKLAVSVGIKSPAPGSIAAMALSSPCVYALVGMTDIARVDVIDEGTGEMLQRWSR